MNISDLNKYQECIKGEKNLSQRRRVELRKLTRFISGCEDPLVRSIMIDRYIKGLSWVATAVNVGGNISDDNCRMIVTRYLKKINKRQSVLTAKIEDKK